jgi:hypothetical protein
MSEIINLPAAWMRLKPFVLYPTKSEERSVWLFMFLEIIFVKSTAGF